MAATTSPPEGSFGASPDRFTIALTAVFWLAMPAGALAVALAGPSGAARWAFAAVMLAAPVIVLALAPRGYRIAGGALRVERLAGAISVPLRDVTEARAVSAAEFGRLWRVAGSGGAHGWFGRFSSQHLGRLSFQATRRDGLVLVRRAGGLPLVLSPDDPVRFLAALNAARAAGG